MAEVSVNIPPNRGRLSWCAIFFVSSAFKKSKILSWHIINTEKAVEIMKICLVGSSGGHLTHLYMLKPFWEQHERFWVTFEKEDAKGLLSEESIHYCYFPTNRNIKNLLRNTVLAWKILRKEQPDILISSGAAVAVPFFFLAKLMKKKLVFVEIYDRFNKASLTGKLVYSITDLFIVQWEGMLKIYPKAVNFGSLY